MKDLFTFMGENPFLTFFLAMIIGHTIIWSFRYIAAAIRGWPPPDEDEDDE